MALPYSDLVGSRSTRRSPPARPGWRVLAIVLACMVGGACIYTWSTLSGAVRRMSAPVPRDVPPEVRPAARQPGDRTNILVIGLDDAHRRPELLWLLSVDEASAHAGVLEIPEDTRAMIAGVGAFDQVAAAYASDQPDMPVPANLRTLKTVAQLLNVPVHETVVMEPEGLAILRTLRAELHSPLNWPRLPGRVMALAGHVQTTIEPARVLALSKLAVTLPADKVAAAVLPGVESALPGPDGRGRQRYFLPDPPAAGALVDRLIRGIDPGEAAMVRVEVAAPGESEQAARLTARLAAQGFAVTTVAPPAPLPATTRVIDLRGDAAAARLVGRSLASQGVAVDLLSEPDSNATADVRVVLGNDAAGR